jgi:hypothetical protein
MPPLTLLLATPLFGLTLTLDPAAVDTVTASAPVVMDLAPAAVAEDAAEAEREPTVAELMARRAHIGRIHKIMGLSTWASMTVSVALGWFQYINLYGFFAAREDTRCARGDAFFGQDACSGQPLPHLISSATTGALYYTTFALSYFMPDPLHLSEGNSESARKLRQHKRLRWAHFAGMAAQILLGALTANAQGLGLDRANDYRALQALSTVHLLTGLATYATLTWAGTIMTF